MKRDEYEYSLHLKEKIAKGKVNEKYVDETLASPDKTVDIDEDEVHFFKKILSFGSRCFKVVLNPLRKLVVTAYFDRNMTKKGC